ncbi:hypothetical protein CEXT_668961 [Caerostris extrusa]|uniref:Uncharacterized protein n=1 Tax=Caerostris extrusa TaxID=172846 RepID=A0AAV4NLA2_CAEEX|nr:hypothetical protein CEXT_668961 [Caerostris extrusa]
MLESSDIEGKKETSCATIHFGNKRQREKKWKRKRRNSRFLIANRILGRGASLVPLTKKGKEQKFLFSQKVRGRKQRYYWRKSFPLASNDRSNWSQADLVNKQNSSIAGIFYLSTKAFVYLLSKAKLASQRLLTGKGLKPCAMPLSKGRGRFTPTR